MPDKEKNSSTEARRGATKPKKKSAKKKAGTKQTGRKKTSAKKNRKSKKTTAKRDVRDKVSATASSDSSARVAKGEDGDAKAKERIAIAAASAAAALSSERQPPELPSLLEVEEDKAADPGPLEPAQAAAQPSTVSEPESPDSEILRSKVEATNTPPTDAGQPPRPPVESPPQSPDRSHDSARGSRTGLLSTLLVLVLLAIAVFFYVRAISPIQTSKDEPPLESAIAADPDSHAGAVTQNTDGAVESGEINPRLIEALSKHLPSPAARPPASVSTLRPLPDDQIELIRQVFALEPGVATSNNANEEPERP